MTIEEAIAHEKEIAKEIYVEAMLCHANPDDGKLDGCIEDGRYHERLAEWLEELKFIKQWKSDIMDSFCRYDVSSFEELIANARNKAIDDFVAEIEKEYDNDYCPNVSDYLDYEISIRDLFKIAEQLKAGITND